MSDQPKNIGIDNADPFLQPFFLSRYVLAQVGSVTVILVFILLALYFCYVYRAVYVTFSNTKSSTGLLSFLGPVNLG